jgi:hypothetical protein
VKTWFQAFALLKCSLYRYTAACKALSAFIDAAPFSRLPKELLPKAMLAIWKRLQELPTASGLGFGSRAEAAGWGSSNSLSASGGGGGGGAGAATGVGLYISTS